MSKIVVHFLGPLRSIVRGEKVLEVEAETLSDLLSKLALNYGDTFSGRIFDKTGNLRKLINICVNGKDVRLLNSLNTQLKDGDEVSVFLAVSGGRR
jgi:molybdopterin synthase sulfur carrier subunit